MRTGGQDLRACQLLKKGAICRILSLSTLHNVDQLALDAAKLRCVKRYVWEQRHVMAKVFEYKNHVTDSGSPIHLLSDNIRRRIQRDPQLYCLNQLELGDLLGS